jgi:hypothetical protein
MAQTTTAVAVKMKTFDTLSGAAFDKMTPAELALLSRDELVALTFRIRAIMGTIAAYITATESQVTFDIESEAKVLKMTRGAIAARSKDELEQLALISQEILRRCPFKPGNRFCSLPDEYVLDVLLTWITIEDLAHFDVALLNHMDRRVHLSLLRDTEHGGIHSVSGRVCRRGYRFDSGVVEWLESRNVFMRALKFSDKKQDFPAGFLARTGRKLLQIDMAFCFNISDVGLNILATSCPMLEEITPSKIITVAGIANLGQECPHIHTLRLWNTGDVSCTLLAARLAENYGALKTIKIAGFSDADVRTLAEGCPLLEDVDFTFSHDLTDSAVLSLVNYCPGLHSLRLYYCKLITDAALETLAQRVPGLLALNVSETQVSDAALETLAQRVPGLLSLDVSGTQVSDAGLARLAEGCKMLQDVIFAGLAISDAALSGFAKACPGLQGVGVFDCEQITDESIAALAQHCTGLHWIDLQGTNITDTSLARTGESCGDMMEIVLNRTAITDSGLARLAEGCLKLESVCLHECDQITDVGVASLALHCPLIHTLDLSFTQVTDVGLERIGEGCRALTEIDLCGLNNVSDLGLIKLAEGCSVLQKVMLDGIGDISDAGVLSLAENCLWLYSLHGDGLEVTDALIARLREDYPTLNYLS